MPKAPGVLFSERRRYEEIPVNEKTTVWSEPAVMRWLPWEVSTSYDWDLSIMEFTINHLTRVNFVLSFCFNEQPIVFPENEITSVTSI